MANDKPIIDPANILTDEQLEKLYDEVVEDNLVEKFKEEFQFVIDNAVKAGRNLYLLDVLEQLDFIDEGIFNF